MSKYKAVSSFDYNVQFFDCDYKGRMKMSAILRICAEVAGYDYTEKGFSHEVLWDMNMVFLTSKASVHINSYPTSKQKLTVSTWECGKKGAMFLRGIYFKDKNTGNILIEALTGWLLVDPNTRHIYRPAQFAYDMPQVTDRRLNALPIGKIAAEGAERAREWTAHNTDIDANGHVYNAVYADIASNIMLPEEYESDISNMRINFVSEVKNGEKIELFRLNREKSTVIIGKTEEKICFEYEIIYK